MARKLLLMWLWCTVFLSSALALVGLFVLVVTLAKQVVRCL